jgi:hypothetical protein
MATILAFVIAAVFGAIAVARFVTECKGASIRYGGHR